MFLSPTNDTNFHKSYFRSYRRLQDNSTNPVARYARRWRGGKGERRNLRVSESRSKAYFDYAEREQIQDRKAGLKEKGERRKGKGDETRFLHENGLLSPIWPTDDTDLD